MVKIAGKGLARVRFRVQGLGSRSLHIIFGIRGRTVWDGILTDDSDKQDNGADELDAVPLKALVSFW